MIYVFLANGFEEIEALAFTDILRRANIDIQTVSVTDEHSVTGSHNISVLSDILISQINLDILEGIVLPGGMPGTLNLQSSANVNKVIDYAIENRKLIGAICAAPMILGERSLLKGVCATCYPGFEDKLIGAKISDDRIVYDDIFITSKGAGTTSDFAHCFISLLKGKEIADNVISSMQY